MRRASHLNGGQTSELLCAFSSHTLAPAHLNRHAIGSRENASDAGSCGKAGNSDSLSKNSDSAVHLSRGSCVCLCWERVTRVSWCKRLTWIGRSPAAYLALALCSSKSSLTPNPVILADSTHLLQDPRVLTCFSGQWLSNGSLTNFPTASSCPFGHSNDMHGTHSQDLSLFYCDVNSRFFHRALWCLEFFPRMPLSTIFGLVNIHTHTAA